MNELTPAQQADYFHRSYKAVDGLWFMMLEQRQSFEDALEVDVAVWRVMPKIQARKLKELTGRSQGIHDLHECLTTKLHIEGHAFSSRPIEGGGFEILISHCPWLELLVRSNRQHLAGTIGRHICTVEYSTWAREFGDDIEFEFGLRLCAATTGAGAGCECPGCALRFTPR